MHIYDFLETAYKNDSEIKKPVLARFYLLRETKWI
jgi:hypothetical protein